MNRSVYAGASLLVLLAAVQPSAAADIPKAAPAHKAPIAAPMFNWSGFYGGFDAGYHWSPVSITTPGAPSGTATPTPDSFTFGGHVGWRQQFSGSWVAGIEGDVSWLDGEGSDAFSGVPATSVRIETKWDASLRGILGVASNRSLFYVTAGWSWVHGNGCGFVTAGPSTCIAATTYTDTRDGWTVGVGMAHAYSDNVIVRLEYLYADYGSVSYTLAGFPGGSADADVRSHKVRFGVSWKFDGGKTPVAAKY